MPHFFSFLSRHTRILLGVAVAGVVITGGIMLVYPSEAPDTHDVNRPDAVTLAIASTTIDAEVARTEEAQKRGLGGRRRLNKGTGMLFMFSQAERHGIWMKDMQFPIDIIWVNDGRIVDMATSVPPESYPQVFRPKRAARRVVEVNAGFVEAHHISIGDSVFVK